MLLIFPLIFVLSFLISVYYLITKRMENILLFIIFALPIYITTLSVVLMYGLKDWIPVLQSFKELLVLSALGTLVLTIKKKLELHFVDKLVLFYFFYTLVYVFLPIGGFSFMERVLSFKSISFFPLIYFTGRLIDVDKVYLNKYFHYICLFAIMTAAVLLLEVIFNVHLQTYTGYADYNLYYFNMEPAGHYDLTWTFEIENGFKRFASFYSTPLEHSASTLVTVSVLAALITKDRRAVWNKFTIITFISTLLSITFALSRASFVGYFIMLYVYAWINKKWVWLKVFHYSLALTAIVALMWVNEDLYDFVINTFNFSNSSSITHLFEWIQGIQAMINNPLGLGLGASGKVAGSMGINIGGENQAIIIGVQTGIIATLLYVLIYGYTIGISAKAYRSSEDKIRKLGLVIFLIKVGLIIPILTAEVESYIYLSYLTWFLTGLLINMVSKETFYKRRIENAGQN